tara:strand:- start:18378 stop:19205 length:828 start_codon:yes stop_codon:yes gene_type:complete
MWGRTIFVFVLVLCASSQEAFSTCVLQDSLVVDGQRFIYLAEVQIDSVSHSEKTSAQDWWLGMKWDMPFSEVFYSGGVSSSSLVSKRPLFQVERQQAIQNGTKRWGLRLAYHQPWVLRRSEVSEDVKGWIASESSAVSPLEQVILIPDSLAFERDTIAAPLALGNALRLGVTLEGRTRKQWCPRVSISCDVLRPKSWRLRSPGDPSKWPLSSAEDVTILENMWRGRWRAECGVVVDLWSREELQRSAVQMRVSAFATDRGMWGISLACMTSPTRR